MTNKTYEIKIKKLENGNGYIFGTVVNGSESWDRPNEDIGETYENQLGAKTEGEAITRAAHSINWQLSEAARYQQHKDELLEASA